MTPAAKRPRCAAARSIARCRSETLYLPKEEWDARIADHAERRFTPFVREEGERRHRSRRQDRAKLHRRTGAGQRQPVRGGGRSRQGAGQGRQAGAVRLLVGRIVRSPGDHAGRPRPRQGAAGEADWADAQSFGVAGTKAKPPQRAVLPVENGFETADLAVISETDILGDRLSRPRRKRRAQNFLAEATSLTAGDLVVHIDHGIGRYEG